MPAKAFVLIQTEIEVARANEVLAALRQVGPEVKSADLVTGPYDIILIAEAESHDEIGTLVADKIHFVPGVYRTVTCLAV